jgi:hypothetical protein
VRRCCRRRRRLCCRPDGRCTNLLIAIYAYCSHVWSLQQPTVQPHRPLRCPSVHVQSTGDNHNTHPEFRPSTPRLVDWNGGVSVCGISFLSSTTTGTHVMMMDRRKLATDPTTFSRPTPLSPHCSSSFACRSKVDEGNRLSPPPAPGYVYALHMAHGVQPPPPPPLFGRHRTIGPIPLHAVGDVTPLRPSGR